MRVVCQSAAECRCRLQPCSVLYGKILPAPDAGNYKEILTMSTKERINLVAPCGIDCALCELYICKDNQGLMDYLIKNGIPQEKLPCSGCRSLKGHCPVLPLQCSTYLCNNEKKADYCFNCKEFPCSKLHPAADRADILPHNMKVFNLCTINREGIEDFIRLSPGIKKKYYKGKMAIGDGPQTE